jgi:hypothetical protein
VARGNGDAHVCEDGRRIDYRLVQLRDEVARFDDDLAAWLDSAAGRFAAWLAERER